MVCIEICNKNQTNQILEPSPYYPLDTETDMCIIHYYINLFNNTYQPFVSVVIVALSELWLQSGYGFICCYFSHIGKNT